MQNDRDFEQLEENSATENNTFIPLETEVYIILAVTLTAMFLLSDLFFKYLGNAGFILAELLILVPVIVFLIRKKGKWLYLLRLNSISRQTVVLSALIGVCILVISDEIQRLIEMIFPMPQKILDSITVNLQIDNFGDFLLIGLGVVVVAGFAEEMLFRGFVQKTFEYRKGVTQAVMLSSLLFALIHLNPWWLIQILLLSFLLGILAWRAESILPGVIVHAINNSAGLWSANTELETIPFYEWHGHVSPILLLIAGFTFYKSMQKFFTATEHLHDIQEDSDSSSTNWSA